MNDNSGKNETGRQEKSDQRFREDETLVELRHLLIGPVETQVDRIQNRLDDPGLRSREIGTILPDAITVRSSQDDALVEALSPTVEQAVRFSIRKNLKSFADALFPVIGPAIRKAIAEALRGMVQSLNESMDKSFSLKGLKWRIEAYRAKKSFSEIVLLHSILFRVEQVFLIHRKTGLLLRHEVKDEMEFQDADMVSGMLTAIRDFVADSFRVEDGEGLESILVGDLNVWIEHGPDAILAVVIRGTAPASLRALMKEALEKIHVDFGASLENFEGDTDLFESAAPILQSCLISQYQPEKKKTSPLLLGGLVSVFALVGFWTWTSLSTHFKWLDLLDRINGKEGIVITQALKEDGNYFIRGLRDNLSDDPAGLVSDVGLDPSRVVFHWTPYQALSDNMVLRRVVKILEPPDSVTLEVHQGVLTAKGSARLEWLEQARNLTKNIPGITQFDAKGLVLTNKEQHDAFNEFVNKLKMEKGVVVTSYGIDDGKYHISGLLDPFAANPLESIKSTKLDESNISMTWEPYQSGDLSILLKRADKLLKPPKTLALGLRNNCISISGSASNEWFMEFRRWLTTVPSTPCLDYTDFVSLDFKRMIDLKRSIESGNVLFKSDSPDPVKGEVEMMETLASEIRELTELSTRLDIPVKVTIYGHTDRSGTEERNKRLSQMRAERIMDFLTSRGVPANFLSIKALGSSKPVSSEETEPGLEKNRRISLEVTISKRPRSRD